MDDTVIREDLETIQPDPIDIKGTISPEEVTEVSEVPRGTCTGTLLPDTNNTSTGQCSQSVSISFSPPDRQSCSHLF